MSTRRRRVVRTRGGLAVALLTLLGAPLVAGALPGSAGAAGSVSPAAGLAASGSVADELALSFDWPLDCDIVVEQHVAKVDGQLPGSHVAYTTRVTEGGAPGNLLVTFGPAAISELTDAGGSPIELAADAVSAYLTNPTIEIDRAGLPVAYGYEEWAERRAEAVDDPVDAALLPPVEHRVGVATWPTWVSLWTQLGTVDTDGAESTAPVAFVNEDGSTIDLELSASASPTGDGDVALYGQWTLDTVAADLLVVTDPATLRPSEASYEYSLIEPAHVIDRYDWTFDWSACDDAVAVSELPPPATTPPTTAPATTSTTTPAITAVTVPGFRTIHVDDLPLAALDTLDLIASGGPFPFRQDDSIFGNREGLLPRQPDGYYREFTVVTPGLDHRGARRIVAGDGGELFYTDDHYDSFRVIIF